MISSSFFCADVRSTRSRCSSISQSCRIIWVDINRIVSAVLGPIVIDLAEGFVFARYLFGRSSQPWASCEVLAGIRVHPDFPVLNKGGQCQGGEFPTSRFPLQTLTNHRFRLFHNIYRMNCNSSTDTLMMESPQHIGSCSSGQRVGSRFAPG